MKNIRNRIARPLAVLVFVGVGCTNGGEKSNDTSAGLSETPADIDSQRLSGGSTTSAEPGHSSPAGGTSGSTTGSASGGSH